MVFFSKRHKHTNHWNGNCNLNSFPSILFVIEFMVIYYLHSLAPVGCYHNFHEPITSLLIILLVVINMSFIILAIAGYLAY